MEKPQRKSGRLETKAELTRPDTVKRNNSISEDIPLDKMSISPKRPRKKTTKTDGQSKPLRRQRSTLLSINQVPELPQAVGELFTFGFGDTGRLGLGPDINERKNPYPMKDLNKKNIVDISCGAMHSIALTKDGKLYSWGCNDEGALGRHTAEEEDMSIPGPVENLDGVKIVKVVCGAGNTMAISDLGKLYCWGRFRSEEGREAFSPQEKTRLLPAIYEPLEKYTIVDIAAGDNHCLVLTSTGHVYFWGLNDSSAMRRRIMQRRPLNTLIPERMVLNNIKLVGAGGEHSFALSHNNELYMWGLNGHGQCCEPASDVRVAKTLITKLQGLGTIKAVGGGDGHSIILMDTGKVYAFGKAIYGQLGISSEQVKALEPDTNEKHSAGPIASDIEHVVQVSVAGDHTLALTRDGDIFCWGSNADNEIGSVEEVCYKPTRLPGEKIKDRKFLRIATGTSHSVVLAAKADS